jgi:hypothetical protein
MTFLEFLILLLYLIFDLFEHLHNLRIATVPSYMDTCLIVARRIYIARFKTILFERPRPASIHTTMTRLYILH